MRVFLRRWRCWEDVIRDKCELNCQVFVRKDGESLSTSSCLACGHLVTSKPNAHSKLQSAHSKLQSAHIKFKSLTSNSNRSHQIQIAHSKFKSLTANSNRPQQIQIAHSKFKSFTANYKIINSNRRLRLSTASGTTRLKIFVIHEAATL